MSFFFIDDAGGLGSIAFQTSATSSTSTTITCPTVQQYDVGVLVDFAANGGSTPTQVVPSGFTLLKTDTVSFFRGVASYKLFDGTESGSTLTGMSGDSRVTKTLLVFRPDAPITTVTASTWLGEATTGDPSSQSIAASGQPAPLVRIAGANGSGTTNPTLTGTFDATVTQGSGTGRQVVGYSVQNSSPADDSVDMNDVGTNWLVSGYLRFA